MNPIIWSTAVFKNNQAVVQYRLAEDPNNIREMEYSEFQRYEKGLKPVPALPPSAPAASPYAADTPRFPARQIPQLTGTAQTPAVLPATQQRLREQPSSLSFTATPTLAPTPTPATVPEVDPATLTPRQRAVQASQRRNRRRGAGAGGTGAGNQAGQAAQGVIETLAPELTKEGQAASRKGRPVWTLGGATLQEQTKEYGVKAGVPLWLAGKLTTVATPVRMILNSGLDLAQDVSDTLLYDLPGGIGIGETTTREQPNKGFLRTPWVLPRFEHKNGNNEWENIGTGFLQVGLGIASLGGVAAKAGRGALKLTPKGAALLARYNKWPRLARGGVSGAVRGAPVDFVGVDQWEGRLVDLAEAVVTGIDGGEVNFDSWGPAADALNSASNALVDSMGGTTKNIPLLGYLNSSEEDTALGGRFKNMVEGGATGIALDLLWAVGRTVKLNGDLAKALDSYQTKAGEVVEEVDKTYYDTMTEIVGGEELAQMLPLADWAEQLKTSIKDGSAPFMAPERARVDRAVKKVKENSLWRGNVQKRLEAAGIRETGGTTAAASTVKSATKASANPVQAEDLNTADAELRAALKEADEAYYSTRNELAELEAQSDPQTGLVEFNQKKSDLKRQLQRYDSIRSQLSLELTARNEAAGPRQGDEAFERFDPVRDAALEEEQKTLNTLFEAKRTAQEASNRRSAQRQTQKKLNRAITQLEVAKSQQIIAELDGREGLDRSQMDSLQAAKRIVVEGQDIKPLPLNELLGVLRLDEEGLRRVVRGEDELSGIIDALKKEVAAEGIDAEAAVKAANERLKVLNKGREALPAYKEGVKVVAKASDRLRAGQQKLTTTRKVLASARARLDTATTKLDQGINRYKRTEAKAKKTKIDQQFLEKWPDEEKRLRASENQAKALVDQRVVEVATQEERVRNLQTGLKNAQEQLKGGEPEDIEKIKAIGESVDKVRKEREKLDTLRKVLVKKSGNFYNDMNRLDDGMTKYQEISNKPNKTRADRRFLKSWPAEEKRLRDAERQSRELMDIQVKEIEEQQTKVRDLESLAQQQVEDYLGPVSEVTEADGTPTKGTETGETPATPAEKEESNMPSSKVNMTEAEASGQQTPRAATMEQEEVVLEVGLPRGGEAGTAFQVRADGETGRRLLDEGNATEVDGKLVITGAPSYWIPYTYRGERFIRPFYSMDEKQLFAAINSAPPALQRRLRGILRIQMARARTIDLLNALVASGQSKFVANAFELGDDLTRKSILGWWGLERKARVTSTAVGRFLAGRIVTLGGRFVAAEGISSIIEQGIADTIAFAPGTTGAVVKYIGDATGIAPLSALGEGFQAMESANAWVSHLHFFGIGGGGLDIALKVGVDSVLSGGLHAVDNIPILKDLQDLLNSWVSDWAKENSQATARWLKAGQQVKTLNSDIIVLLRKRRDLEVDQRALDKDIAAMDSNTKGRSEMEQKLGTLREERASLDRTISELSPAARELPALAKQRENLTRDIANLEDNLRQAEPAADTDYVLSLKQKSSEVANEITDLTQRIDRLSQEARKIQDKPTIGSEWTSGIAGKVGGGTWSAAGFTLHLAATAPGKVLRFVAAPLEAAYGTLEIALSGPAGKDIGKSLQGDSVFLSAHKGVQDAVTDAAEVSARTVEDVIDPATAPPTEVAKTTYRSNILWGRLAEQGTLRHEKATTGLIKTLNKWAEDSLALKQEIRDALGLITADGRPLEEAGQLLGPDGRPLQATGQQTTGQVLGPDGQPLQATDQAPAPEAQPPQATTQALGPDGQPLTPEAQARQEANRQAKRDAAPSGPPTEPEPTARGYNPLDIPLQEPLTDIVERNGNFWDRLALAVTPEAGFQRQQQALNTLSELRVKAQEAAKAGFQRQQQALDTVSALYTQVQKVPKVALALMSELATRGDQSALRGSIDPNTYVLAQTLPEVISKQAATMLQLANSLPSNMEEVRKLLGPGATKGDKKQYVGIARALRLAATRQVEWGEAIQTILGMRAAEDLNLGYSNTRAGDAGDPAAAAQRNADSVRAGQEGQGVSWGEALAENRREGTSNAADDLAVRQAEDVQQGSVLDVTYTDVELTAGERLQGIAQNAAESVKGRWQRVRQWMKNRKLGSIQKLEKVKSIWDLDSLEWQEDRAAREALAKKMLGLDKRFEVPLARHYDATTSLTRGLLDFWEEAYHGVPLENSKRSRGFAEEITRTSWATTATLAKLAGAATGEGLKNLILSLPGHTINLGRRARRGFDRDPLKNNPFALSNALGRYTDDSRLTLSQDLGELPPVRDLPDDTGTPSDGSGGGGSDTPPMEPDMEQYRTDATNENAERAKTIVENRAAVAALEKGKRLVAAGKKLDENLKAITKRQAERTGTATSLAQDTQEAVVTNRLAVAIENGDLEEAAAASDELMDIIGAETAEEGGTWIERTLKRVRERMEGDEGRVKAEKARRKQFLDTLKAQQTEQGRSKQGKTVEDLTKDEAKLTDEISTLKGEADQSTKKLAALSNERLEIEEKLKTKDAQVRQLEQDGRELGNLKSILKMREERAAAQTPEAAAVIEKNNADLREQIKTREEGMAGDATALETVTKERTDLRNKLADKNSEIRKAQNSDKQLRSRMEKKEEDLAAVRANKARPSQEPVDTETPEQQPAPEVVEEQPPQPPQNDADSIERLLDTSDEQREVASTETEEIPTSYDIERRGAEIDKEAAEDVVNELNESANRQLEGNSAARSYEADGVPARDDSDGEVVRAVAEAPEEDADAVIVTADAVLSSPPVPVTRPTSGSVEGFPIADLRVRQDIFQAPGGESKVNPRATYQPQTARELQVWFDADGELGEPGATYVVNGHHRLELARNSEESAVNVRYISGDVAPTAREASIMGALQNVVDRGGKSAELAEVLRRPGVTPAIRASIARAPRSKEAVKLARIPADVFVPIREGKARQVFRDKALALGDRDLPPEVLRTVWNAAEARGWSAARIRNAVWEVGIGTPADETTTLLGAVSEQQMQRRITIRAAIERNANIPNWKEAASSPQVREVMEEIIPQMGNDTQLSRKLREHYTPELEAAAQRYLSEDLGITDSGTGVSTTTVDAVTSARAGENKARKAINKVKQDRGKPETDTVAPPSVGKWRENPEAAERIRKLREERQEPGGETLFSGLPIPDFFGAVRDIQHWGIGALPLRYQLVFGELFAMADISKAWRQLREGGTESLSPDQMTLVRGLIGPNLTDEAIAGAEETASRLTLDDDVAEALEEIRPNKAEMQDAEVLRGEDQRITTEISDTRGLMQDLAAEEGIDLNDLRDLSSPQWQQLTPATRGDLQTLMEAEHLLLQAQGELRAEAGEVLGRIQPTDEALPSAETVAMATAQVEQLNALPSSQEGRIRLERARIAGELREVRRQKRAQQVGIEPLRERRETLREKALRIQEEATAEGVITPEVQRSAQAMGAEAAMLDEGIAELENMRPLDSLIEEEALLEAQLRRWDQVSEALAPRSEMRIGGVPARAAHRVLNWLNQLGVIPSARAATDDAAEEAARQENWKALPGPLKKALNKLLSSNRDLSQRIKAKGAADVLEQAEAEQLNRGEVTAERVGEAVESKGVAPTADELTQEVEDAMPSLTASPDGLMRELDETNPVASAETWRKMFKRKVSPVLTDQELTELAHGTLRDFDLDPENLGPPAQQALDRLTPMLNALGRQNTADFVAARLQVINEKIKTARIASKYLNLGPDADPALRDRYSRLLIEQSTETLKLERAYDEVATGLGRTLRAANPRLVSSAPYSRVWMDAWEARLLKEQEETPLTVLGHKISPELTDILAKMEQGEPVNWNNQKVTEELKGLALTMKSTRTDLPATTSFADQVAKSVDMGLQGLMAIRTANLLSAGTTWWVNSANGVMRSLLLPMYAPFGAVLTPRELPGAVRRAGLTYIQMSKQIQGAFKLAAQSFNEGITLWDPSGTRTDTGMLTTPGQGVMEVRPGIWDLNAVGSKEFHDNHPHLSAGFDWLWKGLNLPLRAMAFADVLLKANYGNAEHWTRLYQQNLDQMIRTGDTEDMYKRAALQADRRLKSSHMDVLKHPDDLRRKRIIGGAQTNEHALRAGRAVTFTDDMLAQPERRTPEHGVELAEQESARRKKRGEKPLTDDQIQASALQYATEGGGNRVPQSLINATRAIWYWPAALADMKKAQGVGPLVNLVATFLKTPTDIVKTAMRHSPAAPLVDTWLRDVTSEDMITRQRARGEVVAGSLMIGGFYFAVNHATNLEITGSGPHEWKSRRRWTQQEGKVPFAWRTRKDENSEWDEWNSYRWGEPYASIIAVMADHRDRAAQLTEEEIDREGAFMTLQILGRVAATMAGKTWFADIQELSEMIQRTSDGVNPPGRRSPIWRWFTRQAATFIPRSSAGRRFVRDTDNVRRTVPASDAWGELSQELRSVFPLPGWSDDRPAVLDPLTAEVINVHGLGGSEWQNRIWFQGVKQYLPNTVVQTAAWPTDPVKLELAKQGVDITDQDPRKRFTENGRIKDNYMNQEEWNFWLTQRGQTRLPHPLGEKDSNGNIKELTLKERLENLIASGKYQDLPDYNENNREIQRNFKGEALREVIKRYNEHADGFFIPERSVQGSENEAVTGRIKANLASFNKLRSAEDFPKGPAVNAETIEKRSDQVFTEITGNR